MSAAKRVAHAAETVRARWGQQVSTDPQTEAAQALEDTGQLLDPEVAAELVAFRKERELAEAVTEHGAFPVPFGSVDAGPVVLPLELLEAQIDALAAAGNRVVNDEMHQHLCMCDAWPKSCVSTGNYFMGAWDVSGLEAALPAVLGLWERMRGGELETLRDRIAELESGIAWRDAERARWSGVHYLIEKAIDKGWSTLDTLDVEAELGPEVAPVPAEPVAEPSCLCPPADQPGPHQFGCPLAEVPRPPLKGRARLDASAAVAAEATHWKRLGIEDPHDSPLHHPYRLGHDLPETGGAGRG